MALLPDIAGEKEISADGSKQVRAQNELEKWLQQLQRRADVMASEEFQDFLELGLPGTVEQRMCKRVC